MPRIAGLALAVLMVLGFAVPAVAGENSKHDRDNSTLFATGQIGTVLLAIDVEKGTTTVIGPTGQPGGVALAVTLDGRAAYTIVSAVTGFPSGVNGLNAQLAKIDLKTGAAKLVGGPMGGNLSVMGMTFAPNGVLYAAGELTPGPTFNSLYRIDLKSGLATRVGSLGPDFIMSFAFDPDGNMYGASPTGLYRIHLPRTTDARGGEGQSQESGQGTEALATRVVYFSGTSFVGASKVMGIAFDESGSLYAADFRPTSTIYAVDIETGILTKLFTSFAFVHNIAFSPQGHHD
jgi:hypothetical protein